MTFKLTRFKQLQGFGGLGLKVGLGWGETTTFPTQQK